MTRSLPIVVLVSLFALTGCQKGAETLAEAAQNSEIGKKALAEAKARLAELDEEVDPDAAAENGAEDGTEADEALADEAAAEADAEPVELDAAIVNRVLAYHDDLYEVQKAYMDELQKDVRAIKDEAEGENGLAALGTFAKMAEKREAQEEKLDAEKEKLLARHDVTEPQVEAVNEIMGQVAMLQMGDMEGTAAKMRKALDEARAKAPEGDPGLADFEAQVEKMEAALKFTEMREKYGDAPVDAVLARKEEVGERYKKMLTSAFAN